MLRAHELSFEAGGRRLLDRVSLALEPGRVCALVGENGAGKSTLLRLLSGELTPASGAVDINGRRMHTLRPLERARLRAVLPQETAVAFGFTAREVVLLGRYPHCRAHPGERDHAIAEAALAAADAAHLAARDVTTLSGGERARVMIARALAQIWDAPAHGRVEDRRGEPRYLLLDEPTASLDIAHQHAALDLARRFAAERGIGVLAVLHDLNLAARHADRVVMLKAGRVVAEGPPAEALTREHLAHAFGVEALVMSHPRHESPLVVIV